MIKDFVSTKTQVVYLNIYKISFCLCFFFCNTNSLFSLSNNIQNIDFGIQLDTNKTVKTDTQFATILLKTGNTLKGKIISDTLNEITLVTLSNEKYIIPKDKIQKIRLDKKINTRDEDLSFINTPFFLINSNGLAIGKKEFYVQNTQYLGVQFQYGITDHLSAGISTTVAFSPAIVNLKYNTKIIKSNPKHQNQLELVSNLYYGNFTVINDQISFGIGYIGLAFGTPRSQVNIGGGILETRSVDYKNLPKPPYTLISYFVYNTIPFYTASFTFKLIPELSLIGEIWKFDNNYIYSHGVRFFSSEKTWTDFSLVGFNVYHQKFFGIPSFGITRKLH